MIQPRSEISEAELITKSHHGTVYICRMCYDNKKKIVIVRYNVGGKHEVIPDMCDGCAEVMTHCPQCKKPAH